MDFPSLSEPLTAALIGALATVAGALVQLRISWRREMKERERGQPLTKKTRRGPVIVVFALLVAAAVGGFSLSQYFVSLRQRDRDAPGAGPHERAQADRNRGPARGRLAPRRGRRERERRGRAVQARRRTRSEAGMHRAGRDADRDLRKSARVGDGQGSAALRARCEFQAAVGGSPGAGRAGRGAGALR